MATSNLRSVVSKDSEHVVKVFSDLANGHLVHRVVESWNRIKIAPVKVGCEIDATLVMKLS